MTKEETLEITIPETCQGDRLDKALAACADDLSRTRIKALMLDGQITRNGVVTSDPSFKVKEGEVYTLTIPPIEEADPVGEDIPLDILFEDDDLIVINKPVGLVIHPGAGNHNGTLVNALLFHCGDSLSGIGGVRRPGIVHRLDKDTSGVMLAAKNDAAHQHLSEQFSVHSIARRYHAIVTGCPLPLSGRVDTLIARHPVHRQKMAVHKKRGKVATTHYAVKSVFRAKGQPVAALVECTLETGRTHQVRVHLAHLGHGLVGDKIYGGGKIPKHAQGTEAGEAMRSFPRQALHAAHLGFIHPISKKEMIFDAALPKDMKTLVKVLKKSTNQK